ncbi:MAG: GAF domain-containing protein, partial [Chloroflexi bacterium]|nr:GAF domain-containing protein [Chloroflexota bacterium]
ANPGSPGMPDPSTDAALTALIAGARRIAVAARVVGDVEERLLQSIVDATVRLFHAEAASIALHEGDPERLEFRVAAGEQGGGAIGLTVEPSQGIVGYVFSTGQALSLSDVALDPRFDRATAERTGYVPRSIAAVPLIGEHGTVGVLQVLDKRESPTFSLRDMELLAVFAAQAATAIGVARVQRDGTRLLVELLNRIGSGELPEGGADALAAEVTAGLDAHAESPFWELVERVAEVRALSDREMALVGDILAVVAAHARPSRRRG